MDVHANHDMVVRMTNTVAVRYMFDNESSLALLLVVHHQHDRVCEVKVTSFWSMVYEA